jgi:hypothetical protein
MLKKKGVRGYLHKFDKSMAYTAACAMSDAFYGVGTPEHKDGAQGFDPKKSVGVWRCSVSGETSEDLPPPWRGREWIAGPAIRLLQSQGYQVTIHEGWVFPQSHELMSLWAKRLWETRQSFEDEKAWKHPLCREFAYQSIKKIANSTVGTTAFSNFGDESADQRRPDIRMQTVARNAEIVYHNILKVQKVHGVTPALIYMDAVYYLSDNPDGRAAFPTIVEREGKLGGYKYEGKIAIDSVVGDILASSSNAATKLEHLNKIGWN